MTIRCEIVEPRRETSVRSRYLHLFPRPNWLLHVLTKWRTVPQDNRARQARLAGRAKRGGNPICPRRAFLACLALHAQGLSRLRKNHFSPAEFRGHAFLGQKWNTPAGSSKRLSSKA